MGRTLRPDQFERLRKEGGFLHPDFGDLGRLDAVVMDGAICGQRYTISDPYYFHLTVTGRCNARCKGCINSAISFPAARQKEYLSAAGDLDPVRDARAVISLLEGRHESEVWICFYGGEPLLRPELMEQFMAELERINPGYAFRYMLYTNGQLLDRVMDTHRELMEAMSLISVSIDGQAAQHNRIRAGTDLEKIHENLERLKGIRKGPVLMWSTLRESQSLLDCFEEFLFLQTHGLADHFFWHWVETEEPFEDFVNYLQQYERADSTPKCN